MYNRQSSLLQVTQNKRKTWLIVSVTGLLAEIHPENVWPQSIPERLKTSEIAVPVCCFHNSVRFFEFFSWPVAEPIFFQALGNTPILAFRLLYRLEIALSQPMLFEGVQKTTLFGNLIASIQWCINSIRHRLTCSSKGVISSTPFQQKIAAYR